MTTPAVGTVVFAAFTALSVGASYAAAQASTGRGADSARAQTLGKVDISAHTNLKCAPLDSPRQSQRVHDWVHHGQDLIRSRRAIELEYTYSVRESGSERDQKSMLRDVHRTVHTQPNDSIRIGFSLERVVTDSSFASAVCVDTVLTRAGRGVYEVGFKELYGPNPHTEGTLRMAEGGMITEIFTEHIYGDGFRDYLNTLSYHSVAIEGQPFQFIAQIVGGAPGDSRLGFTYSNFVHIKK